MYITCVPQHLWTNTALIPSIVAEEWDLVAIRGGFQWKRLPMPCWGLRTEKDDQDKTKVTV